MYVCVSIRLRGKDRARERIKKERRNERKLEGNNMISKTG
jgi:hypothetical protein